MLLSKTKNPEVHETPTLNGEEWDLSLAIGQCQALNAPEKKTQVTQDLVITT